MYKEQPVGQRVDPLANYVIGGWVITDPPFVREESGIFYEENGAPKAVPRLSGGRTMTDSGQGL